MTVIIILVIFVVYVVWHRILTDIEKDRENKLKYWRWYR